ncbi:hypothetical protein DFH27DRAFT_39855 [Peziza echinospora]|nr:hypothetical protein DFH27DRAFT_39855 [Peziza echinospora]
MLMGFRQAKISPVNGGEAGDRTGVGAVANYVNHAMLASAREEIRGSWHAPWTIVSEGLKRGEMSFFWAISWLSLSRMLFAIAVPSIFWATIARRVYAENVRAFWSRAPDRAPAWESEAFVALCLEASCPQTALASITPPRPAPSRAWARIGREAKVTAAEGYTSKLVACA